jgi:tellurite resistance protein TerC
LLRRSRLICQSRFDPHSLLNAGFEPRNCLKRRSLIQKLKPAWLRRVLIAVIGSTVVLIGVALLVLPGPGLVTIALGLAILATEFVFARALLKKAREAIARNNPLKR